jgi:hypothetical protein
VFVKTLVDKEKTPAWKSLLLPLLFTGNQIANTVAAGDMTEIIVEIKKAVVTLSHSGRGWEFVNEE